MAIFGVEGESKHIHGLAQWLYGLSKNGVYASKLSDESFIWKVDEVILQRFPKLSGIKHIRLFEDKYGRLCVQDFDEGSKKREVVQA